MTAGHDMTTRIHGLPPQPAEPSAEDTARQMQALSEGVPTGDTVECLGKRYRIRSKVGSLPLMRYAHAAASGLDSSTMEGLAATWQMLKDCIHPDDWPRFVDEQTEAQANDEDLFALITQVTQLLTARPTQPRSGSSPGPQPSTPSLTGSSSPQPEGRVPDWARETVPVAGVGLASRV